MFDDNHEETYIINISHTVKKYPPHSVRLWLLSHRLLSKLTLATKETKQVYLMSTLWVCFHSCGGCPLFAIWFAKWFAYLNGFKPKCYGCQGSITDKNNDTFDKAQLRQWKLATDSQRVMSDCLSVSCGRQSMTPSMQYDHINNITKIIQCMDSSFRTLARVDPSPQ